MRYRFNDQHGSFKRSMTSLPLAWRVGTMSLAMLLATLIASRHHASQLVANQPAASETATDDKQAAAALPSDSVGVRSQPLSPTASAAMLQIADGFHIQLLASEPEVASPVDAAFDDRGRMWVVEMIDYPFQKPSQEHPRGRIRILSDRDHDGRYETAQVFADKINMPTGLAMWRDGIVVTLGGQLVWMRDTNHDDQVDTQEVWLEGFAQQNEQLRANHPRLEMDGKWYIASGLRGGKIQVGQALRGESPADAFDLGTRDVRLDAKSGLAEAITGPAQFGLTSDPCGTRMFCTNRNPCVQVVFEQGLLANNPLAGIVPAVSDVLASGENSRVYPLIEAWTTSNLHAGQFTAACGVHFQHVPADKSFSAEQLKSIARESLGRVFACEPTGSLVHMENVQRAGSIWRATAASQSGQSQSEWLASKDPWFKPVNVLEAPGGGVLVIDMHRAVIEHPAWVPDELKNRPDERFGEFAGRVYWAATSQLQWPKELMQDLANNPLSKRDNAGLVNLLQSPDSWLRRNAARLLIEREAVDVLPELKKLAASENGHPQETQIAALQLINLFDPGASRMLMQRLTDTHRLVQITALRLLARTAIPSIAGSDKSLADCAQAVTDLAMSTEDAWLRLEATITSARIIDAMPAEASQKVAESLGKLAAAHPDDAYLLVAAAGAARKHSGQFLVSWLDGLGQLKVADSLSSVGQDAARDRWLLAACKQLVTHVHKNDSSAATELLARARFLLTDEQHHSDVSRLAALTALTQHVRLTASAASKSNANAEKAADASAPGTVDRPMWRKVREIARLPETTQPVRLAAIELLGLSPRKGDTQYLAELAEKNENVQIRLAATKAWAEKGSAECDAFMLQQFPGAGPALRPTLAELLLARPERQAGVLAAMERGELTAKQLGAVELKRFVDRSKGETKAGFTKQLDSILNSDRAAVLKKYQACLDMTGDQARGKQIFAKQCAACHRIGDVGVQVGPDISDSRVQTADKLLTSVLDPNRAIDNNYFRFVVLTSDGRTIDGLIAEETSDKVVIRSQNDQRHVIARSEIEQLKPTGVSMMPEGLESQIDPQSMADLIAFIKNWRYTSGQIPAGIKAGK